MDKFQFSDKPRCPWIEALGLKCSKSSFSNILGPFAQESEIEMHLNISFQTVSGWSFQKLQHATSSLAQLPGMEAQILRELSKALMRQCWTQNVR